MSTIKSFFTGLRFSTSTLILCTMLRITVLYVLIAISLFVYLVVVSKDGAIMERSRVDMPKKSRSCRKLVPTQSSFVGRVSKVKSATCAACHPWRTTIGAYHVVTMFFGVASSPEMCLSWMLLSPFVVLRVTASCHVLFYFYLAEDRDAADSP